MKNTLLKGILVPVALAMVVMGVLWTVGGVKDGDYVFAECALIPLGMGILSSWYWRNLGMSGWNECTWLMLSTLILSLMSLLFLGEGYICLIIISPMMWVCMVIGVGVYRFFFRRNKTNLNLSFSLLLAMIFLADVRRTHHYTNCVSDTMVVNAPPDEVWKYVVAYEPIRKPGSFWLFRLGLPSPVQSTATGDKAGAERKCIFSNGYVFDEKIVTYEANRNLVFDITRQPLDPEIMGHIDIRRGQFLLRDNGDGTTTLTGNSWYELHVFPAWYFDLWAESVTRNVHLQVMEHIKTLSER